MASDEGAPEHLATGICAVASAVLASKDAVTEAELELASRILKRAISAPRLAGPRELETMVECFNRQMDAVIDSANRSAGLENRSARRAALARDLDQAGLVLVDRDMLAGLIMKAEAADDGEDLGAELLDGEPWDGKIRPGAVCRVEFPIGGTDAFDDDDAAPVFHGDYSNPNVND